MIQITKDQAAFLRAHGIGEGITRPLKQKSKRGKRMYAAEERHIVKLLDEYAKSQIVLETYGEID
jgi:hypothetical protein